MIEVLEVTPDLMGATCERLRQHQAGLTRAGGGLSEAAKVGLCLDARLARCLGDGVIETPFKLERATNQRQILLADRSGAKGGADGRGG